MGILESINETTLVDMVMVSALTSIITQAAKMSGLAIEFLPWLAMGVGGVLGILSGWVEYDGTLLSSAAVGILVGGFTAGLFDGIELLLFSDSHNRSLDQRDYKQDDQNKKGED